MAQFDIYEGRGEGIKFLIDLQHDMLENLSTRIVAPLVSPETAGPPMRTVNPLISVGGEQYILMTQLLAAIPISTLNGPFGSCQTQREEIVAAINMLFTGL